MPDRPLPWLVAPKRGPLGQRETKTEMDLRHHLINNCVDGSALIVEISIVSFQP